MRTFSGSGTSAGDFDEIEPPPPEFTGGESVGRYVILRSVGSGGMGVVYLAHDPELDRRVALKFLRGTKRRSLPRLRGRLLREAQAMARVNHPNVIKVHDVGEHRGRLFLAMEYVEGQTLDRWFRSRRRPWQHIIEVFIQAGRGLVAAHEQGLVHRDFKPDNVLVGTDGSVRVMDFGLVRALSTTAEVSESRPRAGWESEDDDQPIALTRAGDVVGTPAYMAPEQHLKLPADAAADQFAFCVSVYEGLYRRRPFRGDSRSEVAQAVLDEAVREAPSSTSVPEAIHAILVRGLARDPDDRWPSMDALLDALVARTVPRSRAPMMLTLGAAGLVAAAVWSVMPDRSPCDRVAEPLGEVWGAARRGAVEDSLRGTRLPYIEDTWSRVDAELEAWTDRWRAAAIENCEATQVRRVQDEHTMDLRTACLADRLDALGALVRVLDAADAMVAQNAASAVSNLPDVGPCSNPDFLASETPPPADPQTARKVAAVRQRLSSAVAMHLAGKFSEATDLATTIAVDASAVDYPPLHAEVSYRRGVFLASEGRHEAAREALEQAFFEARRYKMAALARDAAIALTEVVGTGLSRHEEALEWAEHARAQATRSPDTRADAQILGVVGAVHRARGAFTHAIEQHEKALSLLERSPAENALALAEQHASLGAALGELARHEEGREHLERAVELRESTLGARHPVTASSHVELATTLRELGRYDESLSFGERALAVFESAFDGPHPWLAKTHDGVASSLMAMGRTEEALAHYEEAIGIHEALGGENAPTVATALSNMGVALRRLGRHEASIVAHERALRIRETVLGTEHPKAAVSHNNLGACLLSVGRYDDAARHFERALDIRRRTLAPDHPLVANALVNLAQILVMQGRYVEALPLLREAVDVGVRTLGSDHPDLAVPLIAMADALHQAGRSFEAIPYAKRAVSVREESPGDATVLALARFSLARALDASGLDRVEARTLAMQALMILERDAPDTDNAQRVRAWLAGLESKGRK